MASFYDRDRDGKATFGETMFTLQEVEEFNETWERMPEKDSPVTYGELLAAALVLVGAPVAVLLIAYQLIG